MTDDNVRSRKIFEDPKFALKVWLDERRSRDVSAGLMWENLKFFSILISGLITANTFFLGFIFDNASPGNALVILGYSLTTFALPILIIYLSLCGVLDLKRRWERTLEATAHLTKLEELVGLRSSRPEKREVFEKDNYLFQRYFKETIGIVSEDDFKEKKMKKKPNMYTAMRKVYWGLIGIGVLLLAIPLFIILY